jgi:hypothetical protein
MAEKKEKKEGNIKFADIQAMYESGMMGISSRTLDLAHAYKVVSFKTRLKNAYQAFNDRREQLLKEVGIDDGNRFANRLQELSAIKLRSEDEEAELKDLVEKNKKFGELFGELQKDFYEIEPKTMPFEEWRKLQEENKDVKFGNFEMLAQFETILEGILWKAPEE